MGDDDTLCAGQHTTGDHSVVVLVAAFSAHVFFRDGEASQRGPGLAKADGALPSLRNAAAPHSAGLVRAPLAQVVS